MFNRKEVAIKLKEYYENSDDYLVRLNSKEIIKPYLFMINKFLPNKRIKVLEIGCGSGISTKFIKNMKPKNFLVAVDISKKFIEYAKDNYNHKDIIFKQDDVMKLSFRENSFDYILMYNVIEHVPYPQKALDEVSRVIKKGGCVLIMSPNHLSPITPLLDFLSLKKRPPFSKTWFGNIPLFFSNLHISIKKLICRNIKFILIKPILDDYIQTGGDSDAVYKSCQIDLIKFFKKNNFKILNVAYSGTGFSKIIGKLLPYFAGGFCVIVRKN